MPIPDRPCPLCHGHANDVIEKFRAHHLVRCRSCSMVFTGYLPTASELESYYAKYPVHDQVSPVTIKRFHELLDMMTPYRKTGRMIDVGCGAGHFLECAANQGWSVSGTEFGTRAMAACASRHISMIEGPLEPSNYELGSFDVVCSFEVVEHITDPMDEWTKLSRLLRPGGILYATTPNFQSIGRTLAGKEWSIVNYPEHLNYFTPHTLWHLAKASGFEKGWVTTTGIIPNRTMTARSASKTTKRKVNDTQEELRRRIESNPPLRWAKAGLNSLLNFTKKGDSMKALFIKPLHP